MKSTNSSVEQPSITCHLQMSVLILIIATKIYSTLTLKTISCIGQAIEFLAQGINGLNSSPSVLSGESFEDNIYLSLLFSTVNQSKLVGVDWRTANHDVLPVVVLLQNACSFIVDM